MGSINSEEIISILKTEIENYDMVTGEQEVGSVIWVGDGIATIYGIEHAMYGEIVIFENGVWCRISSAIRSAVSFSEKTLASKRAQRSHARRRRRVFQSEMPILEEL